MKNLLACIFLTILFSAQEGRAENHRTGPLGFGIEPFTQEMETDRPDFTEGTQTVQPGHIQHESGYTYTYDDGKGSRSHTHEFPEFLLRAGLTDDFEFRLSWPGYVSENENIKGGEGSDSDGFTGFSVGFKKRIAEQDNYLPTFSIIGELGLPVGSADYSSDRAEPGVKLLFSWDLNDNWSAGSNLNLASVHDGPDRYFESAASFSVARSLSEEVGMYVEYIGIYPGGKPPEEHYLSSGLTIAFTPDIQGDLRAGFGATEASSDFFSGAGISYRL